MVFSSWLAKQRDQRVSTISAIVPVLDECCAIVPIDLATELAEISTLHPTTEVTRTTGILGLNRGLDKWLQDFASGRNSTSLIVREGRPSLSVASIVANGVVNTGQFLSMGAVKYLTMKFIDVAISLFFESMKESTTQLLQSLVCPLGMVLMSYLLINIFRNWAIRCVLSCALGPVRRLFKPARPRGNKMGLCVACSECACRGARPIGMSEAVWDPANPNPSDPPPIPPPDGVGGGGGGGGAAILPSTTRVEKEREGGGCIGHKTDQVTPCGYPLKKGLTTCSRHKHLRR